MSWLVAVGLINAALASVLAMLAWSVGRWCRRPALARLLWIVVLGKLLTPPLLNPPLGDWFALDSRWISAASDRQRTAATFAHESLISTAAAPQPRAETLPDARIETSAAPVPPPTALPAVRPSLLTHRVFAATKSLSWLALAGIVWLCGSAASAVWLVCRTWRFRRLLNAIASDDADLGRRVAQLARGAGLRTVPRTLVVDSAVSPMLWGAGRRACLLFPAELARRLDPAARDALLLHELAHYARADWLVRLLELTTQVFYWWHPLVWWARAGIEAAEEECCDAWVVEQQAGERRTYAEALLGALDFLCEARLSLPPATCGLGAASLLRRRLMHIMTGEVAVRPSRAAKSAVMIVAALLLPLGPAFVSPQPGEAAARNEPRATVGNALRGVPHLGIDANDNDAERYRGRSLQNPVRANGIAEISREESKPASWFIASRPRPRASSVLYATAVSPNGQYKLEARTGHGASLTDGTSGKRLDLSAYRILSASFSPDSRRLVTGQDDESAVRLWDCETGGMLRLLKGSESAITSVAFAGDGLRVAAGAVDGSVWVWVVGSEEPVARLTRQEAPVACLRWSPGDDRLAIAVGDWSSHEQLSLIVWQPSQNAAGDPLPLDRALGAVEWLTDHELVLADWSGAARVVDLTSGAAIEQLWFSKDAVSAAAFSPDCRLVPRWQASSQIMGEGP